MIRDLHRVLGLVESGFPRHRVLVIGDLMLDQYLWGEVNRISPEAPVPVLRSVRRTCVAGGAGNVAMNLAGLGVQVALAGFIGGDPDGEAFRGLLTDAAIPLDLLCPWDRPTISKTRVMAGRQQLMRLDVETPEAPSAREIATLIQHALRGLEQADSVILSDYAKGSLPEPVCQAIIGEARKRNVPVLVDPKGSDFTKYRQATTICPNLQELSVCTGVPARELDELFARGRALLAQLAVESLTVTMSERGIHVLRPLPENDLHASAQAREVYDVSGAGDTVIATLAAAAAARLDPESAIQLANVAAGIVVGHVGTAPVDRASLLAILSNELTLSTQEKVVDRAALVARAAQWRARGETIVFTNGCFDLLHIGHITLLEDSHRMGDHLVIGINSDASVRRLKGPARPIVGEKERARILAALASTDAVVVFEEDTPLATIEALRPDVLVKGGDYTESTVVGAEQVRSWGGRVAIVPTVAGFSTTNIVNRMTATADARNGAQPGALRSPEQSLQEKA
jgi:D-beta-D-heptose 7-phosphate kinase/D-beta-D-heptose 1-phosphate adenosyltransferase